MTRMREASDTPTNDGECVTYRPLRVLYFGVRDEGYPRNERLRAFLRHELGAHIDVVPAIVGGRRIQRYLSQLKLAVSQSKNYDVVVLSEFSLNFFAFSWLAAKRARAAHVVDFFVGLHETEVGDNETTRRGSARAKVLAWVDRMAIRSSDACFTDTSARARRFRQLDGGLTPFASLPVGAPAWARIPKGDASQGSGMSRSNIRLLYYGSYLALHGLGSLIEGLQYLEVGSFSLVMIGQGPERPNVEALVHEYNLSEHVVFLDFADPQVLVAHIENADIVLGVFGQSEKAAEVIANKVWQGLSLGKIVVTRESVALNEIAHVAGNLLVQVSSPDPLELSRALRIASQDLEDFDQGLEQRPAMGLALEQLVEERYALAFSTEPYASIFRVGGSGAAAERPTAVVDSDDIEGNRLDAGSGK